MERLWGDFGGFFFVVGDENILGDKFVHSNIDLAHDDDVPSSLPARCHPAPFAHPSTPCTAMPIPSSIFNYWEYDNILYDIRNSTCVRQIMGLVGTDGNDQSPSQSEHSGPYHPCLKPNSWGGNFLTPPDPNPNTTLHGHTGEWKEWGEGIGKGGTEEGLIDILLTNLIFDHDLNSVACVTGSSRRPLFGKAEYLSMKTPENTRHSTPRIPLQDNGGKPEEENAADPSKNKNQNRSNARNCPKTTVHMSCKTLSCDSPLLHGIMTALAPDLASTTDRLAQQGRGGAMLSRECEDHRPALGGP